jgi:hypothetical protein
MPLVDMLLIRQIPTLPPTISRADRSSRISKGGYALPSSLPTGSIGLRYSSLLLQAFNLLLRRLKPLEHFQSYPSEFRDLSYLLSVRAVSEGGGSFRGWGGTAEGREEIVRELKGMGGSLGGWNGASASAASVGGGKGGGSSKDQSAEGLSLPYYAPIAPRSVS